MEELGELRSLTEEDIGEIRKGITRPIDVDEILFNDVLTSVIDSRRQEIIGVESDGRIKELLRQRELREQERLSRIQIKLTRNMREIINGPTVSEGAAPKMYQKSLIPSELHRWKAEIQEEVNNRLGIVQGEAPPTSEEKKLDEANIHRIVNAVTYRGAFKGDLENVKMNEEIVAYLDAQMREELTRALRKIKIREERIGALIVKLQAKFEHALTMPGKLVGNIMASSFGEAATQQTLNTFHSSGDKNARKQITGFGKFNSLLEATENATSTPNMLTIFMNGYPTGDQMRLNISKIQATLLSDIVESHRIVRMTEAQPRWEMIADTINGISYSVMYPKDRQRFNLHRENPIFTEVESGGDGQPKGRILEIKLNVKEMFFRRISMSQVASAIEQISTSYRVVTSSLTIGLIRIYFKFEGLPGQKGEISPAISLDLFRYTLENSIYPSLLTLRITGIAGVTNVYVQNFKISPAIDFSESNISNNVVTLKFEPRRTIMSGLRENDIRRFINAKMQPLMKNFEPIQGVYDENDFSFQFNITNALESLASLKEALEKERKTKGLNPLDVIRSVLEKDGKINFLSLLDQTVPLQLSESARGSALVLTLRGDLLAAYRFTLENIAIKLSSYLSGEKSKVTDVLSGENSPTIYIYGLTVSGANELLAQLETFTILSEYLQELTVRWYYSAEGRNLGKVLAYPHVDKEYTRGDNIVDVYRILGVESARSVLVEEIFSNVDSKIHPAHIELLADSMTYRTPGDKPLAQNHHGMMKRGAEWGGLMWQETSSVALNTGLGQVDNLQSFPSRIFAGVLGGGGTMNDQMRQEVYENSAFQFDFWKNVLAEKPAEVPVAKAEAPTKATIPKPLVVAQKVVAKDVARRRAPKKVASIPVSQTATPSLLAPQPTLLGNLTPASLPPSLVNPPAFGKLL